MAHKQPYTEFNHLLEQVEALQVLKAEHPHEFELFYDSRKMGTAALTLEDLRNEIRDELER